MFLIAQLRTFIVLAISSSRLRGKYRLDCAPTGTGLGVYLPAYPVSKIISNFFLEPARILQILG